MSKAHRSLQNRPEFLRALEWALRCHFPDDKLCIDDRLVPVDDILAVLQRHVAQAERALAARETWLEEAQITRDEFRNEINPLLGDIRKLLERHLGADSPWMQDFGFEPGRHEVDDGEDDAKGGR